ncbi:hypothetical protein [Deinococcus sp. QL22]|nr:hypothetical protein [Deinococcus sp. QL22]
MNAAAYTRALTLTRPKGAAPLPVRVGWVTLGCLARVMLDERNL